MNMATANESPELRRTITTNEIATPHRNTPPTSIRSLNHTPSSLGANQANSSNSPNVSRAMGGGAITVESALAQANGSYETALSQVVSERNQFHTQNALLWKHIEKVKDTAAGFKKDLDRIRAERDRALDRISTLTGEERRSRPTTSSQRAASIDISGERPTPSRALSDTAAGSTLSLTSINESPSAKQSKAASPSRPPISSESSFTDGADKQPRLPPRSELRPTVSTSVIPPTPTKKQTQESQTPLTTPTLRSVSQPSPSTPASILLRDDSDGLNASRGAPAERSASSPSHKHEPSPTRSSEPASINPPSTLNPTSTSQSPILSGPSASSSSATLKPGSPPDIKALSKERASHVTIPDEASRYITSMVDSPHGSPAIGSVSTEKSILNGVAPRSLTRPSSLPVTVPDSEESAASTLVTTPLTSSPKGTTLNEDDLRDEDEDEDADESTNEPLEDSSGPISEIAPALSLASSSKPSVDSDGDSFLNSRERTYEGGNAEYAKPRRAPELLQYSNNPGRPSVDTLESTSSYPQRSRDAPQGSRPVPPGSGSESTLSSSSAQPPVNTSGAQSAAAYIALQQYQQHSQGSAAQQGPSVPFPSGTNGPQTSNNASSDPRIEYKSAKLMPEDLVPPNNQNVSIKVEASTIKSNERGKEVLSFVISVTVAPTPGREGQPREPWRVEKLYSDVLGLDGRVRISAGRKRIAPLPDSKLFKDNAPAKVDQRKVALEQYLQSLIQAPLKRKDDVCMFFSTNIVRTERAPVHQLGHKEGYLTKRSKNFGGFMKWKTRYFVLNGFQLDYYESRGGQQLGTISVQNAQIGRQQKPLTAVEEDENAFRHAFLIIEARKPPGTTGARHVLCAESDAERDSWVDALVRRVADAGYYDEQSEPTQSFGSTVSLNGSSGQAGTHSSGTPSLAPPPSESSLAGAQNGRKTITKDLIGRPLSSLPPPSNSSQESPDGQTPTTLTAPSMDSGHVARSIMAHHYGSSDNMPLSSSLPDSLGPLHNIGGGGVLGIPRASSEMGHYSDLPNDNHGDDSRYGGDTRTSTSSATGALRVPHRYSYHPSLPPLKAGPTGGISSADISPVSTDNPTKKNISGPLSGAPIPLGYNFGGKDGSSSDTASSERERKTKSSHFWPFGGTSVMGGSGSHAKNGSGTVMPRAVFGVPIVDALQVSQIANLPSVVFRCIQYLEAKEAEREEGIYRLSGSSAVIKTLKDRFNNSGDFDLLGSDEYWDPHAVAGLLKSYFRELPSSILTSERHFRFLKVIDLADVEERITELSALVASLPFPNYCLLRALSAHLIRIVQNSSINKMTVRNVGIVFSPTLGIPAGVFSLMLGEFPRVFDVDGEASQRNETPDRSDTSNERPIAGEGQATPRSRLRRSDSGEVQSNKRNSVGYAEGSVDRLLGMEGRILATPEEGESDVESMPADDSEDETEGTPSIDASEDDEKGSMSDNTNITTPTRHNVRRDPSVDKAVSGPHSMPDSSRNVSHGASVAATRGLQIRTEPRTEPRPWVASAAGLPASPRPVRGSQSNSPAF